jgi:type II secretory pathway pseudopilin PulG
MQAKRNTGLTLIEICVVVGFLAVFAGLSLTSLSKGKDKAPTRGMAYGLAEEFRAARQLAIGNGHPVAVSIPTSGGAQASTSIYRLSGWNVPKVDWARDYASDFPGVSFAAARFSSSLGAHTTGVDTSAISKFGGFDLNAWIPDQFEQDNVFCFMPDGGLVTNGLPALNNDYTVVVGKDAAFSASSGAFTVTAATEPMTIRVGTFGGLEIDTGLPGGSVPVGTSPGPVSAPVGFWEAPKDGGLDEIYLSNVIVRPTLVGGEGKCKPGQTVNLEVFAYSPQGVELFARWKQSVLAGDSGNGFFTYPSDELPVADSDGNTSKEMDRMEYLADFDPADFPDVVWTGAPAPTGGVFRARWSWTVPLDSDTDDTYHVGVDVQNVEGTAVIKNPPPEPDFKAPEGGSVLLEQRIGGVWQLVRMNPDGSGRKPLSPPGVAEYLPTVDRAGDNMAYLQDAGGGNTNVMLRPLDGSGPPVMIAANGNFTSVSISPNGNFIAYRDNGSGQLSLYDLGSNSVIQNLTQTLSAGEVRKCRAGWSWDSKYMVYEHAESLISYDVSSGSSVPVIAGISNTTSDGTAIMEDPYSPVIYKEPLNGTEYMIFSAGNFNPVLCIVPFNPTATIGIQDLSAFTTVGNGTFSSAGLDDDYPSVSVDGRQLILTRSPEGTVGTTDDDGQELIVLSAVEDGNGNFTGPPRSMGLDVRRGFFVP